MRRPVPIGIKGIMTARDATRAAETRVDIVWMSNHGGRQVDHTQGWIDALPPSWTPSPAAPPSSWTAPSSAVRRC
jgi:isopentenyl diphosphate isomerase/L-lactate dehydrogenase-like FMN-dependent dehydrogenase